MILRKGACCWGAFGWLHVQLGHGHLMYRAIHSEFAHRYSYKSHTVPSCSGKKKVRVMEKLLESVSSPMVCFPQLLTLLSYAALLSPLPFLNSKLFCKFGKEPKSKSVCWSCFSKNVAWKEVCYLLTAN